MSEYEAVIGLEVHAQLRTKTKIFCGCPTDYGAPPNTHTCTVCLGHPGALPVLNDQAVRHAVRAALALGATVHRRSVFARKNYFYPDLPKGYQISQFDEPLATGGSVPIEIGGATREIGLIRLHLEEDAGKSIHDGMPDSDRASYVDLNRTGVPLVEIVSRPEVRSPEEAYLYLQRLRSVLRYTGVCDGNMEEGSLRCDANVSIRPEGATELGTRTELKNLNSFRNVQRALDYELERQREIVESGGSVEQETRLWDAAAGETRPMRGKEEAHDYRYFPEPDLLPLLVDESCIEEIRSTLPVHPAARKALLLKRDGISPVEAHLLTLERPLVDFYEEVAEQSGNPKASANFILNDLLRERKSSTKDEEEISLPATHLAGLIKLVDAGRISNSAARRVFPKMLETGATPEELIDELGLEQVSDEDSLRQIVRETIAAHPEQHEQYRAGKKTLLAFFVGKVMRASGGRANPRTVNELLEEMLK